MNSKKRIKRVLGSQLRRTQFGLKKIGMDSASDSLGEASKTVRRVVRKMRSSSAEPLNSTTSASISPELLRRQELAKSLQHEIAALFKAGDLRTILDVAEANSDLKKSLSKRTKIQIRRSRSFIEMLDNEYPLPEKYRVPIYTPVPGKLMYFVHQTPGYVNNGYVQRSLGLLKEVANHRDVVVAARPGFPQDQRHKVSANGNFEEIHDGLRFTFVQGGRLTDPLQSYFAQAIDANIRRMEAERPAIIQSASNYLTAFPAMVAARLVGVPFVYEMRGAWELGEPLLPDGDRNDRYRVAEKFESLLVQNADFVFALNEELAAFAVDRGADRSRIEVLPNGVDLNDFYGTPLPLAWRKQLGLDDGYINIAYVGSMVDYEGLDILADAFKKVHNRHVNTRLLLVGDGPVAKDLKVLLSDLIGQEVVLMPGAVEGSVARKYIEGSDIVVIPRRNTEVTRLVSPLKPLEALAAGKALVLSDLPVSRVYSVDEGAAASLVTSEDSDALAAELLELISDRELRLDRGRLGRRWVRENRSWVSIARTMNDALNLLDNPLTEDQDASRTVQSLRIGLIADEFSRSILSNGAQTIHLNATNWREQLEGQEIDFLLCESAWEGIEGTWNRRVGYYNEVSSQPLIDLLEWCKEHGVPTVFWNKEDPVHYERFIKNATLFDHIFTTDAASIEKYSRRVPVSTSVLSLPFYVSPSLHHPVSPAKITETYTTFAFAGTYYGDRFKDRSDDFDMIAGVASQYGLTIYDRHRNRAGSPYRFPQAFDEYVHDAVPYERVPDLYRAHPIHININSVRDSQTMFARRVVEIASCGRNIVSNKSISLDNMFGSTVPLIGDREDMYQVLEKWFDDPDQMLRNAWALRAIVREGHTLQNRLALIARIVGISVLPEKRPDVSISFAGDTPDVQTESIRNQHFPVNLIGRDHNKGLSPDSWYGEWDGSYLDERLVADVVQIAQDVEASCVDVEILDSASVETKIATFGQSEKPSFRLYTHFVEGPTVLVNRPKCLNHSDTDKDQDRVPLSAERKSLSLEPKRVLVAGHDLKFAMQIIDALRNQGHEVKIDKWNGHNSHSQKQSEELLEWAQVVFCEWGLGNAVWYSRKKRSDQRLVVRVHSQEVFLDYLCRLNLGAIDEMIFVAEHIRHMADGMLENLPSNRIISNVLPPVDGSILAVEPEKRRFNIGLVGIVPMQKSLHRALDLLALLHETDKRYRLTIKGNMPGHYPWMLVRSDEMSYYYQQLERVVLKSSFKASVDFAGFDPNLESFYFSQGSVLSMSDFESQHLTVFDGALRGAVPYVLDWPGADRMYSSSILSATVEEMAEKILADTVSVDAWLSRQKDVTEWARIQYDFEDPLSRCIGAILGAE